MNKLSSPRLVPHILRGHFRSLTVVVMNPVVATNRHLDLGVLCRSAQMVSQGFEKPIVLNYLHTRERPTSRDG